MRPRPFPPVSCTRKTIAEDCEIMLEGENKWLTIVKNATRSRGYWKKES